MAETQKTTMSRRWLIKIAIFLIGLPAVGLWGLYDATIKYPARGAQDASRRLYVYLEKADEALAINSVAIADPAAELERLEASEADLITQREKGLTSARRSAEVDLARLDWLRSLKRLWTLEKDTQRLELQGENLPKVTKLWNTREGRAFVSGSDEADTPRQTLDELRVTWESTPEPEPLSGFDLLVQWGIAVVFFSAALYPLYLILRVARTRFTYEPETRRLTLPSGVTFVPDEIKDVDKRKWHKFYVTVLLKDGEHHTFDLLRFHPLEEWILEMEKTAFPERAAEEAAAEDVEPIDASPESDDDASDEEKSAN